jgi:hypothetical protein
MYRLYAEYGKLETKTYVKRFCLENDHKPSRHFCTLCFSWKYKHFKQANHSDELATYHSH